MIVLLCPGMLVLYMGFVYFCFGISILRKVYAGLA